LTRPQLGSRRVERERRRSDRASTLKLRATRHLPEQRLVALIGANTVGVGSARHAVCGPGTVVGQTLSRVVLSSSPNGPRSADQLPTLFPPSITVGQRKYSGNDSLFRQLVRALELGLDSATASTSRLLAAETAKRHAPRAHPRNRHHNSASRATFRHRAAGDTAATCSFPLLMDSHPS